MWVMPSCDKEDAVSSECAFKLHFHSFKSVFCDRPLLSDQPEVNES